MSNTNEKERLSTVGLYHPRPSCPILAHLQKLGHEVGKPCLLATLNKIDNMNYYGSDATLEMLNEINKRGHWKDETETPPPLTIIDVGSGYGGTSRVLINALPPNSRAVAIDIQESVHETARSMTVMAELAGDVTRDSIDHVCADCIRSRDTIDAASADLVICRLCALHVDRENKTKLYENMKLWLKPGGVVAFEDYADGGLSPAEQSSLEPNVAVPYGSLLTVTEWKNLLEKIGFVNVVVEDMTTKWAAFVKERHETAERTKEETDELYGGSERREFFRNVCELFNPKEGKRGLVGVRVYGNVPL